MKTKHNRRVFIKSALAAGASAPSLTQAASAAPPLEQSKSRLRFAIVSDGHFGQPDTDFKRFHEEMVFWLNQESLGKGLDLVVFNGDLIHDSPPFLPRVKAYYDRLQAPYYVTKGNHDRVSGAVWKETWGYEENHDFKFGEYGFLLMNTSNEAGEYLCADAAWLEDRLRKQLDKARVFVFMHISQNKVTRNAVSCPAVAKLLEETENVTAVFHGHDHDLDHVIFSNQQAYLFDGHMGGSWGVNYRGYRIVEIDQQGKVGTYQCNPQAFFVNGLELP